MSFVSRSTLHAPLINEFFCLSLDSQHGAVVAEWLRRLTRNQLGSARTGSNPVHCDWHDVFFYAPNSTATVSACKKIDAWKDWYKVFFHDIKSFFFLWEAWLIFFFRSTIKNFISTYRRKHREIATRGDRHKKHQTVCWGIDGAWERARVCVHILKHVRRYQECKRTYVLLMISIISPMFTMGRDFLVSCFEDWLTLFFSRADYGYKAHAGLKLTIDHNFKAIHLPASSVFSTLFLLRAFTQRHFFQR